MQKPLEQVSIAYLGDARNNVANSLLEGAALMGMDIRMVGPEQLHTDTEILNRCLAVARKTGARISIGTDIEKGVTGADFYILMCGYQWVNQKRCGKKE